MSPDQPPASHSGRSAMEVALNAAHLAGGIIRDRFQTSKQVSYKGRADIVTDVDLAAERAILEMLREEYPEFGTLAEESKPTETLSPYTWVVDPLDGTRNYANGIPHFCTVVALVQKIPPSPLCERGDFQRVGPVGHQSKQDGGSDEVILGVTYDPIREELFSAELGRGAFLNRVPLKVSGVQELSQALLGCDLGYVDEKAGLAIDLVRALWPGIVSLRLMGSAALGVAYAAAGRVDLYFHHSLSPWDIAAGLLLVREAGGTVVDRQGQRAGLRTPSVIASSHQLVDRFLQATEGLAWRG